MPSDQLVLPLRSLQRSDVERVGGKNASLGEMLSQLGAHGIRVPEGFATTAQAFGLFLDCNGLRARIDARLAQLDIDDVRALAAAGAQIRGWVGAARLPAALEQAVRAHYAALSADAGVAALAVAVRSSATAEDLPDASFAGQQETFLNVVGIEAVLLRLREVFASLYNDRAISYRVHQGYAHAGVALSVGVQRMVRSDLGAAGVLFTLDTESGYRDVVLLTASYGLGETVVQGAVNPDEFYVHKPMLAAGKFALVRRTLGSKLIKMVYGDGGASAAARAAGAPGAAGTGDTVGTDHPDDTDDTDRSAGGAAPGAARAVLTVPVPEAARQRFCLADEEVLELARYAVVIERHYGCPMDIEWGKDGLDGQLYILQARPETVQSRPRQALQTRYRLKPNAAAVTLTTGRAIGQKIGSGAVRVVRAAEHMDLVQAGDVLVTEMTDPHWEPVMQRAAAIVTDRGGRTCHAAIIARELGIPAVVGCGDATAVLHEGRQVTVSCAEGDTGVVYDGRLEMEVESVRCGAWPDIPVKITLNVGNPQLAFHFQSLPNAGVGLARLEFIINNHIGVHPKAVLDYPALDATLKLAVERLAHGYASPREYFAGRLCEGVATIAAAFWPKPVIVRLSDFKSNEYKKLIGGSRYEPDEENPMLGFRGAARFIAPDFRDCFALECAALRRVRTAMGYTNVEIMVPFVRTLDEARQVTALLAEHGLQRGEDGLRLIMMCELPANAVLAAEFLQYFDGFSIGSNDLTQLTLGLDRDSGLVAAGFDERDPAVKELMSRAIATCRRQGKYVGICGQGPSDHIDFALWLVDQGISAISLNPDSVVDTWRRIAAAR